MGEMEEMKKMFKICDDITKLSYIKLLFPDTGFKIDIQDNNVLYSPTITNDCDVSIEEGGYKSIIKCEICGLIRLGTENACEKCIKNK